MNTGVIKITRRFFEKGKKTHKVQKAKGDRDRARQRETVRQKERAFHIVRLLFFTCIESLAVLFTTGNHRAWKATDDVGKWI